MYTVDWVQLKTADLWLWTTSDTSPWAHLLVVGTLIQQSLPTPFPSVLCDDFSLTGPFICICFLKTLPIEPRFPLHPLFWPVPRYALSALIGSYNRERERGGERERERGGAGLYGCVRWRATGRFRTVQMRIRVIFIGNGLYLLVMYRDLTILFYRLEYVYNSIYVLL